MESWNIKKFKEATEPSLDDFGDVGDFEQPANRLALVAQNIADVYWSFEDELPTTQAVVSSTLEYCGCSFEELLSSLRLEGYEAEATALVALGSPDEFNEAFNPIAYLAGESEGFKPTEEEILRTYLRFIDRKRRAQNWGAGLVAPTLIAVAKKFGLGLKAVWDSLQVALNQEAGAALEESTSDMPLAQWNDDQKQLWLNLVKDGVVGRNDPTAFYQFGKYFDDYYHKTGEVVPYSELRAHFGLQESAEDFGDVGDFEEPANHRHAIIDYMQDGAGASEDKATSQEIVEYYLSVDEAADKAEDGVKNTLQHFHISLLDLIAALEAEASNPEGDYYGYEHLDFVIDALKGLYQPSLQESADLGDVGDFEEPKGIPITKSCGVCGSPIGPNGEDIDEIPEGYEPNDYEHDYCKSCGNEALGQNYERRVTRDMAMDAGDPDLEGQLY
jgi:hypothetical protein